jgi:transcriptional regulator with PAS, ATPase and Fis domain
VQQNAHLWREVENKYSAHGIIGTGQRIQQIVRLVERIRDSLVSVLVTGESGTGKEMAAGGLQQLAASPRALGCAALPETLLESELPALRRALPQVNSRGGGSEGRVGTLSG